MSARRSAAPVQAAPVCAPPAPSGKSSGKPTGKLSVGSCPRPPADAAFSAVLSAPGLPPFVVWSRRPLTAAAADALNDAARTLRAPCGEMPVTPAPSAAEQRTERVYSKAYHGKASL